MAPLTSLMPPKFIPFGLRPEHFARRFREELDRISSDSIQIIRATLAEPLHEAVRAVEILIFVDAENYGAPRTWMYFFR